MSRFNSLYIQYPDIRNDGSIMIGKCFELNLTYQRLKETALILHKTVIISNYSRAMNTSRNICYFRIYFFIFGWKIMQNSIVCSAQCMCRYVGSCTRANPSVPAHVIAIQVQFDISLSVAPHRNRWTEIFKVWILIAGYCIHYQSIHKMISVYYF